MSGHVGLVTGAAGGIGRAVVDALARTGVPVAAVDRDEQELARTVSALTAAGLPVSAFTADVASTEQVEAVVERVEHEVGPIGYLVNAAGILRVGEAVDLTDQDWDLTLAVNAGGVFHVSRAVARRMMTRRTGAIVTVASNAARTPRWGMASYAASKAAATSFTKCLGLELAGHGIRCNVVAPGSTETKMLTSLWATGDACRSSVDGEPALYRLGIPLRRLAQPEDIAAAVLFLLSEQAAHITLHDLTVDGGAALGT